MTVYDHEPTGNHDLVGSAKYFIDGVIEGKTKQAPVEIFHKNK